MKTIRSLKTQTIYGKSKMVDKETTYLSIEELVNRYSGKIKKGTLANWRSGKEGPPYVKVGGRVFYPLDRLIAWESSRLRPGRNP